MNHTPGVRQVLDVVASERHYASHLAPIWLALDRSERGRWYIAPSMREYVTALGIPDSAIVASRPSRHGGAVMVASFQDLRTAKPRPAVMVAHGAGQTYGGDPKAAHHPSYSAGGERENVRLNLCAGPQDLEVLRAAHPDVPAVAVGAPKLDRWHRQMGGEILLPRSAGPPTVAISFHADINLCPESRWAWPHYGPRALELLRDDGRWRLIGHAHPRAWPALRPFYERLGIEAVRDFDEVLDRTNCYVIDNSSTAYEAASCGIPVVLMNAPWYRREIHHGLRFWDTLPGETVDGPDELPDAVSRALDDPPELAATRETAVARVYTACDGRAAQRAAEAIREHMKEIAHEPQGTSRPTRRGRTAA